MPMDGISVGVGVLACRPVYPALPCGHRESCERYAVHWHQEGQGPRGPEIKHHAPVWPTNGTYVLYYLRPGTREHFLENLARDWPELLPRYEALYAGRAYLRDEVIKGVRRRVRDLARDHGVADRREHPLVPAPAEVAEQLPLTAFLQAPTGEA